MLLIRSEGLRIELSKLMKYVEVDDGHIFVKEGEAFNLLKDPDTKYRVKEVKENSVIITYQTGEEPENTIEIEKN